MAITSLTYGFFVTFTSPFFNGFRIIAPQINQNVIATNWEGDLRSKLKNYTNIPNDYIDIVVNGILIDNNLCMEDNNNSTYHHRITLLSIT